MKPRFISYAQNQEDVLLWRAFGDIASGYYVDVGANDPTEDSVTKAFYDRGWRGINIEPSPFWCNRLARSRTEDTNLCCAAYSANTELEFFEIHHTGLSTSSPQIADDHASHGGFASTPGKVPARTLDHILNDCAPEAIHFLKIDAEGSETQVLKGIDLARWRPWIILVEAIHPVTLELNHLEWEALLTKADYRHVYFDGINRYYVAAEHEDLAKHFSVPVNVLDAFVRHREIQIAASRPSVAPSGNSRIPDGFGFNLIGNLTSGVGLGVIARSLAALFIRKHIPFAGFDIPHAWGTPQFDPALEGRIVTSPERLKFPINLYVLPAAYLESLLPSNPALLRPDRLHIVNFWWEASRIPDKWINELSRFDAVLAMSHFITDLTANSLSLTPVIYGEAPLDLPANIASDRAKFGLPDNVTVFVASLDPTSDPARKNPFALVNAFRAAFPAENRDVRLVIRLNNATTEFGKATISELLRLAGGDNRIGLIINPLSYAEVLTLYASCDVFLSFHRGEGLGLGLMESMALGKPVIATAWSGNMSFMDQNCAALLRYRLAPVEGNWGFFRPEVIGHDARWADPILEDAAAWMRLLHHDVEFRMSLGNRARLEISEYQRRALEARWVDELVALWTRQRVLPRVVEKYSSRPR